MVTQRDIAKFLLAQGWEVYISASGHYRCRSPEGQTVTMTACKRADWRTIRNDMRNFSYVGYRLRERNGDLQLTRVSEVASILQP